MKDLILPEEIKQEMIHYNMILNNVVGMIFVTLFLGSIGTNNPQETAILLLPISFGAFYFMATNYPKSIRVLEEMLKDERYKNDWQEIKDIIKEFKKENFKSKSILSSNIIYMYGLILYWMIVLCSEFGLSIAQGRLKITIFQALGI